MVIRSFLLLLWCADIARGNWDLVKPYKDKPLERTQDSRTVVLECCYIIKKVPGEPTWVVSINGINGSMVTKTVNATSGRVTKESSYVTDKGRTCYRLKLREVSANDTGLYRCSLNHTDLHFTIFTHGTFLQVYKPMPKVLDISESNKNKIILTEAILLLLCVLVPGVLLLCKRKKLNEMDSKRKKAEEENIYEGLNLEDLSSTYHQIQRSQVCSPYQDVDNVPMEDFPLEKP
ncbi:hypothetical protein GJAV_G00005730 [Gymnothorax javanicus]|nr:hypothetical protein GJAV_G00005730 [Gymnothorax javanicus]